MEPMEPAPMIAICHLRELVMLPTGGRRGADLIDVHLWVSVRVKALVLEGTWGTSLG